MNKVKLTFIADSAIDDELLHCLYTTIRFKDERKVNLNEPFKISREGRLITLIMDYDKAQNINDELIFFAKHSKKDVRVKLIKEEPFMPAVIHDVGDIVEISGVICYSKNLKSFNKKIPICPIDFKGNVRDEFKDDFVSYLEDQTGMGFKEVIKSKDNLRFERLFNDEKAFGKGGGNFVNKKVYIRSLVYIRAKLRITDSDKANALYFTQVGKRKSYGFGAFDIIKIDS